MMYWRNSSSKTRTAKFNAITTCLNPTTDWSLCCYHQNDHLFCCARARTAQKSQTKSVQCFRLFGLLLNPNIQSLFASKFEITMDTKLDANVGIGLNVNECLVLSCFASSFFFFKSHSDSFGAWTMDGTIKLSILFQLVTNWSSLGSLFIFLRRFVQWPNRNSDTRIKHIHKVQSQHKKLLSQISGHSRTLYIQLPVRSMFYYFLFIGISASFGRNDLMIDRFRLIFVDFKKVPIVRKKTQFFLKSCVFKHFHVTCDSITK